MRRLASYSLARGTPKSGAQNCTFSRRFTQMGSFVVSVATPHRLASYSLARGTAKRGIKLHIFTKVYNLPGKLEMGSFVVSVAALFGAAPPRKRPRGSHEQSERLRASPPRARGPEIVMVDLAALEPRAMTQVHEFEYLLVLYV